MPRSHQPVQGQMEQAMLPPPLRKPKDLIDECECEDSMDYINEISGDYFSSAQKMLNNYEDSPPEVSPIRSNWGTDTLSAEAQLDSKNVHWAQPPTYSLCPLSSPAPARTYSNMSLKDIIRRRESVPLRRPTISGSFKSPFLPKPPMASVDQSLIPATSEFIGQGQEDGTLSIANPSQFILPASTVPSASVAQSEDRAKRHITKSQSFSLPTSSCAPETGPQCATQTVLLQPHRGMTIRFEPSQKPFKSPLATKTPLGTTLKTSRCPSGFDTTDNSSPLLVNPRSRKVITAKAGAKSGQGAVGVGAGAQCTGVSKVATSSSFAEVQAAW
ncbi:hypothetical protein B9Z19DRAFT_606031 [Tuber borchii]|uniref:Uncharacterized protein n=1 Tax=Tuber borchii TaxID=42251 RepID=A0A2T7A1A3_TUBBO|nr:hypothetical protein B9Z19DRAFT_606031 [Tuber borchii]